MTHPLEIPKALRRKKGEPTSSMAERYAAAKAAGWDLTEQREDSFVPKGPEISPEFEEEQRKIEEQKKLKFKNRMARIKARKENDLIPDKFKVWDQRRSCFVDSRVLDARIERRKEEALVELEAFKSGRARKPKIRTPREADLFSKETTMAATKKARKATKKRKSPANGAGPTPLNDEKAKLYGDVVAHFKKGGDVNKTADKFGKSVARVRAIVKEHG